MKLISAKELSEHLNSTSNFQLLDVREPYEVAICSIGGVHIPMGMLQERLSELDASLPTCVLCKTGNRAAAVANLLETDFSFSQVMVANGGIHAYAVEIDNTLEVYE